MIILRYLKNNEAGIHLLLNHISFSDVFIIFKSMIDTVDIVRKASIGHVLLLDDANALNALLQRAQLVSQTLDVDNVKNLVDLSRDTERSELTGRVVHPEMVSCPYYDDGVSHEERVGVHSAQIASERFDDDADVSPRELD